MSHKTDLKKRTRERMAKTGETYTRARDALRKQTPPLDLNFPYAHRTDLPEHERKISKESLAALHAGIAEGKADRVAVIKDLEAFLGELEDGAFDVPRKP